MNRYLARQ